MQTRYKIEIPFIISVILLSNFMCSSLPKGTGYTSDKLTQVYSKPDLKSASAGALKGKSEFKILEYNIPIKNQPSLIWTKIQTDFGKGYIFSDSMNPSPQLFLKQQKPTFGLVFATSLQLRAEPFTSATPIEKLPTREIVEILEKGETQVTVNGKTGTWARVKSKNEKIGFVFSPFLMLGESKEQLSKVEDFETGENGWAYLATLPKIVYIKRNGKLFGTKLTDELYSHLSAEKIYQVIGRYITKEGKVYFQIYSKEGKQADWYSEVEAKPLVDCYLPANTLKISNRYALLYIQEFGKTLGEDYLLITSLAMKRKLIQEIDRTHKEDIDPSQTNFEFFESKKQRYHVVTTTEKSLYESCEGCFTNQPHNIVFVFKEKGKELELIFANQGSGMASVSNLEGGSPEITISNPPAPEGDGIDRTTVYKFNGKDFDSKK